MVAWHQVHSVEGTAFSCRFASFVLPFIRLAVRKALSCLQVAGMPPKDAKQQKDKAAFANREALQGLAARESQHRQLAAIRLELERLRLLLERVSKRERLKRESEQPTCLQFISCPCSTVLD